MLMDMIRTADDGSEAFQHTLLGEVFQDAQLQNFPVNSSNLESNDVYVYMYHILDDIVYICQ